jgi:F-type H+-transporting ATPase subunit gamma
MANRRVLIKRRKAARNIRKITRTMQLIATARFQAAFNRATATKPYSRKLAELAADLARAAGEVQHPLLATHEEVPRGALVVLTSDRGLAGGYNANVLRAAIAHLDAELTAGRETHVHMVGKKGINLFRFLRREVAEQTVGIGDKPRFERVEPIANVLMERFLRAEIASAHVAFMQFQSAGVQRPAVVRLLPLAERPGEGASPEAGGAAGAAAGRQIEYEFSPSPAELLDELLPATVRMRLYQAFTDAAVSEQVARMVAMKAATDASEEMIRALTLQYNRARQTQITMELLDIVGGASALS